MIASSIKILTVLAFALLVDLASGCASATALDASCCSIIESTESGTGLKSKHVLNAARTAYEVNGWSVYKDAAGTWGFKQCSSGALAFHPSSSGATCPTDLALSAWTFSGAWGQSQPAAGTYYTFKCTDSSSSGTSSSGTGLVCTDKDPNYECPAGYSCGKGYCIPAGSFLCTDGEGEFLGKLYQCKAGSTCGRGKCVPAGSLLCGPVGQKTCSAGTSCCGNTEATKNTGDVTCLMIHQGACPANLIPTPAVPAAPYTYISASSSSGPSSSSMGAIIGGAVGGVVLLGAVAVGVVVYLKKKSNLSKPAEPTFSSTVTEGGANAADAI